MGERKKSAKIGGKLGAQRERNVLLAGGSGGLRERTVRWRWYSLREPESRGRPPDCHHVQHIRGGAQSRRSAETKMYSKSPQQRSAQSYSPTKFMESNEVYSSVYIPKLGADSLRVRLKYVLRIRPTLQSNAVISCLCLNVPGLPEKRSGVLSGDIICLRVRGSVHELAELVVCFFLPRTLRQP